jgi:hypothetical protein
MVPRTGRPGIQDPCLNLNTGGGPNLLVEYKCQRQGNSTNEQWAPKELFWNSYPPPPPPPPPTGAHQLTDGVLTPLQLASDLRCMEVQPDNTILITASQMSCQIFVPKLVPGGYQLQLQGGDDECLGLNGVFGMVTTCSGAVWNDLGGQDASTNRIPLRPTSDQSSCLGVSGSSLVLQYGCVTPRTDQLWYDDFSVGYVMTAYNLQRDSEDLKPKNLSQKETDLWNEVERQSSTGWSAATGIFAGVLKAFKPGCISSCKGFVFDFLNFAHFSVQLDISRQMPGSSFECAIPGTRQRVDVCMPNFSSIAEVKAVSSILNGVDQLLSYQRALVAAGYPSSLATVPPWPAGGQIDFFVTSIFYTYKPGGVYGYSFSKIPTLRTYLKWKASNKFRELAEWYLSKFPLPQNISTGTSFPAYAKAMLAQGYSSVLTTTKAIADRGFDYLTSPAGTFAIGAAITGIVAYFFTELI